VKIKEEIWQCDVCGLVCEVRIVGNDDGLPAHIVGQSRFVRRVCVAGEPEVPLWKQLKPETAADAVKEAA
jgi:hypothetical protein